MNSPQSGLSPTHVLLELVCNHEMYETFHILSEDEKIEQCIKQHPKLFISYHIMRIKYFIHQHCKKPNANLLSNNLDAILQSLCYLIPNYNHNNNELIDTSYTSIFYRLHQEIKIQSILLCNKPHHIIKDLVNTNFKLNPDTFNFRHIDITKDIDANQDIQFDIVDIIEILGSINKKNKNNHDTQQKIENFITLHPFHTFKSQLFDFLSNIQSICCDSSTDLLYNVAQAMLTNHKQYEPNTQLQNKQQYLSKMQYFSKPKPVKPPSPPSPVPIHNNEHKNEDKNDRIYKIGMKVSVRMRQNNKNNKNNNNDPGYIWKTGKIIQLNNFRITVRVNECHMKITDFSKIKPLKMDENDNDNDNDTDIVMIDNNHIKKRPKRNANVSVQSFGYERGRRFWEENEDKALKAGIMKYKNILHVKTRGVRGIWSKIKADDERKSEHEKQLKHRTTKMLYDRYRVFAKKGTLPAECQKQE